MARTFSQIRTDITKPGEVAPSAAYDKPFYGTRQGKTWSQVIADSTRGIDAGMNQFTPTKPDLSGDKAKPDWRGHYLGQAMPQFACDLHPGQNVRKRDIVPGSLYVHRPLTNADDLRAWAAAAGITNLVPAQEMHVTQVYSRDPVGLDVRGGAVTASGGERRIGPLGDKGAVVLHFESPELQARHAEAMAAGASHDFPKYLTHVTLSYDAGGMDLAGIKATDMPLVFGPEVHAEINDDWSKDKGLCKALELLKFDADESRDERGRWTAGGAMTESAKPQRGGGLFDVSKNLTDDEHAVVMDYADEAYGRINRELLGARPADMPDQDKVKRQIKLLDSASQKFAATKEFVVHRLGRDWDKIGWQGVEAGRVLPFKSFLSTSMDEKAIDHFRSDLGGVGDTTYHIMVPPGAHLIPIAALQPPHYSDEQEILLPRNSTFVVDKIDHQSHEVWMKLNPPSVGKSIRPGGGAQWFGDLIDTGKFFFDSQEVFNAIAATLTGKRDWSAVRKDFNPDQARDDHGRWTGDGAAGFDFNSVHDQFMSLPPGDPAVEDMAQQQMDDEANERGFFDLHPTEHHPGGATFSSPNLHEKDFATAQADLQGARQAAFTEASDDIDHQLGLPHTQAGVVGAWSDGAENSIMTESANNDMAALKLSAAMKGYLGRQKAVLVFGADPAGKAAFYDMEVKGSADEVHADLLKKGIEFHTLVPHGNDSTRVVVVDTNGSLGNAIGNFAGDHHVVATRTFGNAEFIGDQEGTGTDGEQRQRALQNYQAIIDAHSASQYQGRSGDQLWKSVRDRWDAHLQTVKRRAA